MTASRDAPGRRALPSSSARWPGWPGPMPNASLHAPAAAACSAWNVDHSSRMWASRAAAAADLARAQAPPTPGLWRSRNAMLPSSPSYVRPRSASTPAICAEWSARSSSIWRSSRRRSPTGSRRRPAAAIAFLISPSRVLSALWRPPISARSASRAPAKQDSCAGSLELGERHQVRSFNTALPYAARLASYNERWLARSSVSAAVDIWSNKSRGMTSTPRASAWRAAHMRLPGGSSRARRSVSTRAASSCACSRAISSSLGRTARPSAVGAPSGRRRRRRRAVSTSRCSSASTSRSAVAMTLGAVFVSSPSVLAPVWGVKRPRTSRGRSRCGGGPRPTRSRPVPVSARAVRHRAA